MNNTILILAASPLDQAKLSLDIEAREIEEGLRRSRYRDQFQLKKQAAVRIEDLRRLLLDTEPQIVHFCGHGSGEEGLVFEDLQRKTQLVSTDSLTNLFELFAGKIECVLLNACYSEVQAKAIVQHVGYVIGMNKSIGDKAAIKFSIGFYDALGAGRSFEEAFKFGCNAIQSENIPEYLTPVLNINTAWKYAVQQNLKANERNDPLKFNTEISHDLSNRFTLIQLLNRVTSQQLDVLIIALEVPNEVMPSKVAPHGDRTFALFQWVESTTGCGLKRLESILNQMLR
jgi:CHAT domain